MTPLPNLAYVFGTYLGTVPNVATLRNTSVQMARRRGDTIFVNGAVEIGDGNGGVYCWLPNSLDDDDGQQTIKPFDVQDTAPGRWKWSIRGDTSLLNRITTLQSEYDDPTYGPLALSAKIIDETTARIEGDQVTIDRVSSLEATVTSNKQEADALVSDESTARANAVEAVASRTSTLEATISDPNTGLAKAQARITDESTTRASADQALSDRVTTVEANAGNGNIDARVTTVEQAVATLDGKTAAYFEVSTQAGDNRAQLSIYADANSGAGVDIVGDVHITGNATIDGNVIAGGSVPTAAIANNAVSTTGAATQSGQLSGTNVPEVVASYNLTTTSVSTLFAIATGHQGYANGVRAWNAYISVSGIGNICYVNGSAGFTDSAALSGAYTNLPAGTYTVTFYYSGTDATQTFANGTLYVQAIYK